MTKKVVFIDDEELFGYLFTEYFEDNKKVEIKTFTLPEEGLAYINENNVDVVFCDFNMPKMSGQDVAAGLKKTIPFYLLTGRSNQDISGMTKVTGIIMKPFEFSDIENLIFAD